MTYPKRSGERIMPRSPDRQTVESQTRITVKNRFPDLGRAETEAVAETQQGKGNERLWLRSGNEVELMRKQFASIPQAKQLLATSSRSSRIAASLFRECFSAEIASSGQPKEASSERAVRFFRSCRCASLLWARACSIAVSARPDSAACGIP
ncbi:hypothetical protein [Jannaschia seosinensis]